jgi:hypothetical protein
MAYARPLRIVGAASFVPAFPLSIAHGVLSSSPVPAVGLVPLAFSASVGIFLISREAKAKQTSSEEGAEGERQISPHPVLVFAVDAVLAAALMVVLVLTWIRTAGPASLAMLAAYTTLPLFINL